MQNAIQEEQMNVVEPKQPWTELILYIVIGFGSYIAASLLFFLFVGNDFSEITIAVTVAIGVLNAVCLIGTVYIVGVRRGKVSWDGLGFVPPLMNFNWLLGAILGSLALIPLRSLAGALVELAIHGSLDSLKIRSDLLFAGAEPTLLNFLTSLFVIGVLVPISEELYFRGLLYRWFQSRFSFWPSVLISSILFGLAHYDSLAVVISSFILGVVCAISFARTNSIWVSIVMHGVTNGAAVFMMYLFLALEQYAGLVM